MSDFTEKQSQAIGVIKNWLRTLQEEGKTGQFHIDYSGYGDSMNDIECDIEIPSDVNNALWELHPSPGFWNNEGGQGVIVLNIDDLSIKYQHEDNVIETEYTERTY